MKTSRPFERLDEEVTGGSALTVYNKYQSSMGALFDFDALCMFWSNSADIYSLVSLQK